jgi:YVTN family beta-propeller protein
VGGLAFLAFLFVAVTGYHHSKEHVRRISGNAWASLDCVPCHVLSKQDGPVASAIPVGSRPHSVVVSRDGNTAYVSNRWSNSVSIVDLAAGEVTGELPVGTGPSGLALTPDGSTLYVANTISNDISAVDLASGRERKRLSAGHEPYAVSLAPDGEAVYVTNRLSSQLAFRESPVTELTVVDAGSERVVQRLAFQSAHVIEGIDFTPSGDWAVVTLVRPKNLLPATQVGRGWMLTFGLGIVDRKQDGRVIQMPLDDVNAFYADPYDVVVTPDGRRAFVSHSGADVVTVVDLDALRELLDEVHADSLPAYANHLGLSDRYVVKRISTGSNPKSMVISPDGRLLYLAERLDDRISVIDVERLEGPEDLPQRRQYVPGPVQLPLLPPRGPPRRPDVRPRAGWTRAQHRQQYFAPRTGRDGAVQVDGQEREPVPTVRLSLREVADEDGAVLRGRALLAGGLHPLALACPEPLSAAGGSADGGSAERTGDLRTSGHEQRRADPAGKPLLDLSPAAAVHESREGRRGLERSDRHGDGVRRAHVEQPLRPGPVPSRRASSDARRNLDEVQS